jgi:hypothetical protein
LRRGQIDDDGLEVKGFCCIFGRFDKLDAMFLAFLCFALVVEALR